MARDEFFATCTIDPAILVTFKSGQILDTMTVEDMTAALVGLVDASQGRPLIFDFQKVTHVSSRALSMLLQVERHATQRGQRLVLCGVGPDLREVLAITRLLDVFDIQPDVRAAVAALQKAEKREPPRR
jgi:anti-anti-sigma factor